jgi:hypothetical protein
MNRRVRLTVRLGRTFWRPSARSLRSKPKVVTTVDVYPAIELPVTKSSPATAADRIHFVGALPGKLNALAVFDGFNSAVKPTFNSSELKGTFTIVLERDMTRYNEIDEIAIPLLHFHDTPLSFE